MSVPPIDNTTRGTAVLAAIAWACGLFATVCFLADDQAAITGVIGAGVPAVLMTAAWWGLHRQDQQFEQARRFRDTD